jgi:uncharacterized protein YdaU (DUF1376 family)
LNFYKHHIGDYAKKTSHLSILEHGAYLLMLHAYYGTEKPLPFGRDLYRICRAFGKKERAAVDSVADQFWTRTDAGFVNGRAFEEMETSKEKAEKSRENGKLGGRPPKPDGLSNENQVGLISEPKNNLFPDSRLQTPEERGEADATHPPKPPKPKPVRRCPPDFTPDTAFALAQLPDLDVEAEVAKFRDWEFKTPRSDWPAVWRTWVRNAKDQNRYAKKSKGTWL